MIIFFLPVLLALVDFVVFVLFNQWYVYSVLIYFLILLLPQQMPDRKVELGLGIIFFLLQDFVRFGRFGLGLVVLVPIMWANYRFRYTLLRADRILFSLSLMIYFVAENVLLYPFFQETAISWTVTIVKIFINLILGYVVFWGTQGNRSLFVSASRGRKVWTPNRKSAS